MERMTEIENRKYELSKLLEGAAYLVFAAKARSSVKSALTVTKSPEQIDGEALASDWEEVGKDLKRATERYRRIMEARLRQLSEDDKPQEGRRGGKVKWFNE